MKYYRFPVKPEGFSRQQLNEIKKMMKVWSSFYAALHDETEDVIPLTGAKKAKRTRYWMEVSDEPLSPDAKWGIKLMTEKERMDAHLQSIRGR
jgi:hypothetical protein